MLVALIMAGGKGSRFWPLSTEEKPKQFLKLIGNKTMLQMTVDRIIPNIPMDRIFICTGENYINFIREQIPNFPERNIIVEPEARNTTACITLSSFIILVLPGSFFLKSSISVDRTYFNAFTSSLKLMPTLLFLSTPELSYWVSACRIMG